MSINTPVLAEKHIRSDFCLKEDEVQWPPLVQPIGKQVSHAAFFAGLVKRGLKGLGSRWIEWLRKWTKPHAAKRRGGWRMRCCAAVDCTGTAGKTSAVKLAGAGDYRVIDQQAARLERCPVHCTARYRTALASRSVPAGVAA
jgi:hypothetical protein